MSVLFATWYTGPGTSTVDWLNDRRAVEAEREEGIS
jgi:hypothetical protein